MPTTTAVSTTTTTLDRTISGRLPLLTPLEVVAAPDGRTAWIAGSSEGAGIFARTEDGGRTWRWVCTARLLTGISMIDARRGVAVAGRAGPNPAILFTTVDGGRTLAARETTIPIDVVTVVDFIDEHHGVVGGTGFDATGAYVGVIATTRDAGATWSVRTFPGVKIEDVLDRPGQPRVAVASRGQLSPVVVLLDAPDDAAQVVVSELAQLREVAAVDGKLMAVGASKPDANGTLTGPSVVESGDGGRTWSAVPTSPSANLHAIATAPTGEIWASGQVGNNEAAVMASSDGGATWSVRHRATTGGSFTAAASGGTALWALGYQTGLAVNPDAPGAGSWSTVPVARTPAC